ncbi:metalloproteinase inhibitor 2-like [Syngnathoides biaculeatus]|uniref:metalloproteinase inhibitor 2-like n=1 Tax=Syngnathoides biaculeatus TaxID=300417 RepID=UPI002ADD3868|nr:metalloproteinase inhibitor 2-like [Syngnathoides biaculeatus]
MRPSRVKRVSVTERRYLNFPARATMSWTLTGFVLLCLWRLQRDGANACRCAPSHPQQVFCQADVVIKAKVVGVTTSGRFEPVKYNINVTKLFKGPKMNFDAIYTAPSSAACGITLAKGLYLLMAHLGSDGSLHISSCDFFKRWADLSLFQKEGVLRRYQKGCDCKIARCISFPCGVSAPAECWWPDVVMALLSRHFACVKKRDASCAWESGFH